MSIARVVGWFGPSLKARLILLAVVLALLGATYAVGYGLGYGAGGVSATEKAAEEARELAAEVAERERLRLLTILQLNEQNRNLEQDHERRVADLRADFARQQASAEAEDARRVADLRAGNRRLLLQVRSCGVAGPGSPDAAPGGADGQARAELAPEVGAALWSIAADGDAAVRQLTALQAWADSAVLLCSPNEPSGDDR